MSSEGSENAPAGKQELRDLVRLTRSARSVTSLAESAAGFDEAINALVAEHDWKSVAAFLPTPQEPPITETLNRLLGSGLTIFVPVSQPAGALEWVRLVPGATEGLVTDSAGMPIPTDGERIARPGVEAVFVPAAAVDRDGNRLGWGKGYYDRFLETIPDATVIAVVFEADIFAQIPTETHDHPVDIIVTEKDIYTV